VRETNEIQQEMAESRQRGEKNAVRVKSSSETSRRWQKREKRRERVVEK